jgi:hypothetical protein
MAHSWVDTGAVHTALTIAAFAACSPDEFEPARSAPSRRQASGDTFIATADELGHAALASVGAVLVPKG